MRKSKAVHYHLADVVPDVVRDDALRDVLPGALPDVLLDDARLGVLPDVALREDAHRDAALPEDALLDVFFKFLLVEERPEIAS
ncbi:MAG: hypothetical protein IMW92_10810 [Bacillales bacterium]|nr:hypothetical protein [Bacillales bacterium]